MFDRMDPERLRRSYEADGLLTSAYDLAKVDIIPELRRDIPMYQMEIRRNRSQGLFRVPYILTQAIITAAHDENILRVVRAILGTDELIMWGPNIQVGTPNEAGLWHTDIESWLWSTITVVVGLRGCSEDNATLCIPHSQRLPVQPWAIADNTKSAAVLEAAQALDQRCHEIRTFEGFQNGRFYLFNAKCWHTGLEGKSGDRELLFLHYDKAANPRIPYMKDYEERSWFDFPATYIKVDAEKSFEVEHALYSVEGKDYVGAVPPNSRM